MAGYTKEYLVDAFIWRFLHCPLISIEELCALEESAIKLYDEVGKYKFRDYCRLDAEMMAAYKKLA